MASKIAKMERRVWMNPIDVLNGLHGYVADLTLREENLLNKRAKEKRLRPVRCSLRRAEAVERIALRVIRNEIK